MRKSHKLDGHLDEESLVLFRELHHRTHTSLLLQPVSNEFESDIGNGAAAYRMIGSTSTKKSLGHELLRETSKNDYDWLKTPPATPLFPSLEMEAVGHDRGLLAQRELTIVQPLSRFADSPKGSSSGGTKDYCKWKAPKPTPTHQRPNIKPKPTADTPAGNRKPTRSTAQVRIQTPLPEQDKTPSRRIRPTTNKLGPAVVDNVRPGFGLFSNPYDPPPNLKKSDPRPTSTSRSRPRNCSVPTASMEAPSAVTTSARRQSCSPTMARRWKQGITQVGTVPAAAEMNQKGKLGHGGGKVFGSSMVDRMMKARRTAGSDDQKRPNGNTGTSSSASKNITWKSEPTISTVTTRSSSRPRSSSKLSSN